MRVGQKNKLTYRWARKGSRPRAVRDQRTQSTYLSETEIAPHAIAWSDRTPANAPHRAPQGSAFRHKPGQRDPVLFAKFGWRPPVRECW
jgi:hypothetical protein